MERIKEFFKDRGNWGFIVASIMLFFVIFLWRENNETKTQLKALKQNEKKAEKMINNLEKDLVKIREQKDSLDNVISKTKENIINITIERDKEVGKVDNYSISDLQRYFDNKYSK